MLDSKAIDRYDDDDALARNSSRTSGEIAGIFSEGLISRLRI
jgi:hypothetical protein